MTTSPATWSISELSDDSPIPEAALAYFTARAQGEMHDLVLRRYLNLAQGGSVNKAKLAKRLRKKPEQMTRWLGSPGNWTVETFTALLLAMGSVPTFGAQELYETLSLERPRNEPDAGSDAAITYERPVKVTFIGYESDDGGAQQFKVERMAEPLNV